MCKETPQEMYKVIRIYIENTVNELDKLRAPVGDSTNYLNYLRVHKEFMDECAQIAPMLDKEIVQKIKLLYFTRNKSWDISLEKEGYTDPFTVPFFGSFLALCAQHPETVMIVGEGDDEQEVDLSYSWRDVPSDMKSEDYGAAVAHCISIVRKW